MSAKLSPGGDLLYKCRMCGKTYTRTHVPDVSVALIIIRSNGSQTLYKDGMWEKQMYHSMMTDIHSCSAKKCGVADLIGGEFDEK